MWGIYGHGDWCCHRYDISGNRFYGEFRIVIYDYACTNLLNVMSVFRINRPTIYRSMQTPQWLSRRLKGLEETNHGEQIENEWHNNMHVSLEFLY